MLLFIAIGLLSGSIFTEKQVGVVFGAVLTNFSAWLSDTWFDLDLVGGLFKNIAEIFPFMHAVNEGELQFPVSIIRSCLNYGG